MRLPYANLKIRHWNPGATIPLTLPVHLICNTSDDEIYDNIRENSRNRGNWIKLLPEHEGVAVLCGSGPSIADYIGDIRERHAAGQTIFAMNGCAKFLHDQGIMPDYQVIIDARPQTADLIGPAKHHLFASQVSPECFSRQSGARLWHLEVGNIENEFPDYNDDYCLIGGAASVGNTATCLAYAMGFRNLQIYGYDSSIRGEASHAFHQPMNDGEPRCVVMFNGKEYVCSLTMKLQAEKFQDTASALKAHGCTIEVHGDGLLPDMFNAPKEILEEAEKYERMWDHPEYREMSPGELCAGKFVDLFKPRGPIIDFGCGTGRGALRLTDLGYDVTMVDFTDNCLDEAAKRLTFTKADLTKPLYMYAPSGFCTDVMEHIPPAQVENTIKNIMDASPSVYFQISTVPDVMGVLIGEHLHLTVRPHAWWRETFEKLGYTISWQEMTPITSSFLVRKPENS